MTTAQETIRATAAAGGRFDRGGGPGMCARAHLATELRAASGARERTCVSTLRSEAPLVLRLTRPKRSELWTSTLGDVARVALAAGAAGPVGGDELTLTVEVGAGSSLVLSEISPTLLLPGPHRAKSRTQVRISVGAAGTLIWLPEPMIAAAGCDHLQDVAVDLDQGARFFMREELLWGRHGETGGVVTQRVNVRLGGRPLYRQDLQVGTAEGGTSPVLADHRTVGSIMIVDPTWADHRPEPWVEQRSPSRRRDGDVAVLPLAGPAVLISALAHDNLQLRGRLADGLTVLESPWASPSAADRSLTTQTRA